MDALSKGKEDGLLFTFPISLSRARLWPRRQLKTGLLVTGSDIL
jgi:hypothetical protein